MFSFAKDVEPLPQVVFKPAVYVLSLCTESMEKNNPRRALVGLPLDSNQRTPAKVTLPTREYLIFEWPNQLQESQHQARIDGGDLRSGVTSGHPTVALKTNQNASQVWLCFFSDKNSLSSGTSERFSLH